MQVETPITDALRTRAQAEYREMPGLKLTAAQAARLWHLGPNESARLLDSMVDAGLLYRARDGAYLLLWDR
jgi:DNA-binding IclR family transcriptional regulator